MAAPKGNRFWEARSSHGRSKIFETPESLWNAAVEYFQWVEDHPLKEGKAVQFQGDFVHGEVNKMRAMTITGLARFLHINKDTWYEYTKREGFTDITREIEGIIYDQKFSGAAADLLNANIIARDLGLRDEKGLSGPDGGAIQIEDKSGHELLREYLASKSE